MDSFIKALKEAVADIKDIDIDVMHSPFCSNKASTPDEKTFNNLVEYATACFEKNAIRLIGSGSEGTNTFQRMRTILQSDNSDWKTKMSLFTAVLFIKKGADIRPEDRPTLQGYVQELVRIGLVKTETTGFISDIQLTLAMLILYSNENQYRAIWDTCIEFVFSQPETDDYNKCCFISKVCSITVPTIDDTDAKTFQGDMAPMLIPFTKRVFELVSGDLLKPIFKGDIFIKDELSHSAKHFLTVFGILISRTQGERSIAMRFVDHYVRENANPSTTAFAEIIMGIIVSSKKYVDMTDLNIVQFIKLVNGLN